MRVSRCAPSSQRREKFGHCEERSDEAICRFSKLALNV